MQTLTAVTMFISVIMGIIFSAVQKHPYRWPEMGQHIFSLVISPPNTTFVAGMSAILNIAYTFMYFPSLAPT
jgi:hypothetical protein